MRGRSLPIFAGSWNPSPHRLSHAVPGGGVVQDPALLVGQVTGDVALLQLEGRATVRVAGCLEKVLPKASGI